MISDDPILFLQSQTADTKDCMQFFTNEELKRELNDADSLSEERLDELLGMFVRDFEAGAVAERGWPTEFSAYKVADRKSVV